MLIRFGLVSVLIQAVLGINSTRLVNGLIYDGIDPRGRLGTLNIVGPYVSSSSLPGAVDIDVTGCIVIPGFIDVHSHVTGGGGEMGYTSRTPEAKLEQIINAGITTLVGISGTDSITRSLENLYAKVKALESDGLTTYMWSGAYKVPVPTLSDSIQRDLMLIDKVIGIGELSISDHRSSWPSFDELTRIVSDTRVAGLLSGKAGKVHFHVGKADSALELLWEIVNRTSIPITQMYPTHMSSRGPLVLEEAMKWISLGGYCDFTASDHSADILNDLKNRGISLERITVSSDGFGSFPSFDSSGKLIKYRAGDPLSILQLFHRLVLEYDWEVSEAMKFMTRTPQSSWASQTKLG